MLPIWLFTYSGLKLDLLNPQPAMISIGDIAHSLSLQCRFNGHVNYHYSVAQHCVLMSQWDLPGDPLYRLLHDAAEAYLGDIITPIKLLIPNIHTIEDGLMQVILSLFKLDWSEYQSQQSLLHQSDKTMLATEICDLFNQQPSPSLFNNLPIPLENRQVIRPWLAHIAEYEYLNRILQLIPGPRIKFFS